MVVNGVKSHFLLLSSGVPQGGSETVFISNIHINDIVKANKYFPIRLFVGDTH